MVHPLPLLVVGVEIPLRLGQTELKYFVFILSNYIIKEKYKEILLYYSEKYPKKQELGIIRQNKEFSLLQ